MLLKVYPVIKRVELEVQETEDPSPEESIPPISESKTIQQSSIYCNLSFPIITSHCITSISEKLFLQYVNHYVKAVGSFILSIAQTPSNCMELKIRSLSVMTSATPALS